MKQIMILITNVVCSANIAFTITIDCTLVDYSPRTLQAWYRKIGIT